MLIGSIFTKSKLFKQNAENTNVIQDSKLLVKLTHLEILQLEIEVNWVPQTVDVPESLTKKGNKVRPKVTPMTKTFPVD